MNVICKERTLVEHKPKQQASTVENLRQEVEELDSGVQDLS